MSISIHYDSIYFTKDKYDNPSRGGPVQNRSKMKSEMCVLSKTINLLPSVTARLQRSASHLSPEVDFHCKFPVMVMI